MPIQNSDEGGAASSEEGKEYCDGVRSISRESLSRGEGEGAPRVGNLSPLFTKTSITTDVTKLRVTQDLGRSLIHSYEISSSSRTGSCQIICCFYGRSFILVDNVSQKYVISILIAGDFQAAVANKHPEDFACFTDRVLLRSSWTLLKICRVKKVLDHLVLNSCP